MNKRKLQKGSISLGVTLGQEEDIIEDGQVRRGGIPGSELQASNWGNTGLLSLLETTQLEACCSLTCNSRGCLILEVWRRVCTWLYYTPDMPSTKEREKSCPCNKAGNTARALGGREIFFFKGFFKSCMKMSTKRGLCFFGSEGGHPQLIMLNIRDLTSFPHTH